MLAICSVGTGTEYSVSDTSDNFSINGSCTLREALYAAGSNTSYDTCPAGSTSLDTITLASATFGLVIGGLIGGPVAQFLITRHGLGSASAEAAAGISLSLTAGFVSWALRAGSMAASFLAAMPTWRNFDPMPVLAADDKKKQHTIAEDEEQSTTAGDDDRVDEMFDR